MKIRSSSSFEKESGFTLAEVAVGLAVSMFLLVSTFQFLSHTIGVVTKLNIQRDIRDQGLMAVETIEREFRRVLEYGGSFAIDESSLWAGFGTYQVSLGQDGDNIVLISGGRTDILSGAGKCTSFGVKGLVDDEYIGGGEEEAKEARVIVIEFLLEDDKHGISRSFKAAFSSANASGI